MAAQSEHTASYTAVMQQHGKWWIGWMEEVRGVNSRERTRKALLENLQSARKEALQMNRGDARAAMQGAFEEVTIRA